MSDLLEEIKDNLQEEKTNRILGKATIIVFILGIIIVVYFGFSSWYNNKQREDLERDGVLLTQLVNKINRKKDNKEKDLSQLENLATKTNAYGALANFYLATIALMDNRATKACYYYQRIAEGNYDKFFQDYAGLVLLNVKLQYLPEIQEEIKSLVENKIKTAKYFKEGYLLLAFSLSEKEEYLKELNNYKNNSSLNFITNSLNAKFNSDNKG